MSTLSKAMSRVVHYRARAGETIYNAISEMLRRANIVGVRISCVFNDVQFTVSPGMAPDKAYALWNDEMEARHEKYERSFRAEVYRRNQQVRAEADKIRGQKVREMLRKESIQVSWYKWFAFKKVVRINSDPYSAAAINFAIAWAVAMQQVLREGLKIADVADQLSRDVDHEGITGFQYGCAVSFLARFWKHGEELRRWHNLSTQVGNEGEKANKEKGGVLNPALLTISISKK